MTMYVIRLVDHGSPGDIADRQNPFLYTPGTPRTPTHPVLDPAMASLEQVSEHIQRQGKYRRYVATLSATADKLLRAPTTRRR